jgi:hypothetical protein
MDGVSLLFHQLNGKTNILLLLGSKTDGGDPVSVLVETAYSLFPDYKCVDNLGSEFTPEIELCGGTTANGACTHDGGSPVIVKYDGDKSVLLGLNSFANGNFISIGNCC